jgi:hypothetical protein
MFYVLTTVVWILSTLVAIEFAIFGVHKDTDQSSKKPFGCC